MLSERGLPEKRRGGNKFLNYIDLLHYKANFVADEPGDRQSKEMDVH